VSEKLERILFLSGQLCALFAQVAESLADKKMGDQPLDWVSNELTLYAGYELPTGETTLIRLCFQRSNPGGWGNNLLVLATDPQRIVDYISKQFLISDGLQPQNDGIRDWYDEATRKANPRIANGSHLTEDDLLVILESTAPLVGALAAA
jgi:hypothetical protein